MPRNIIVYHAPAIQRSGIVGRAMFAGIRRHSERVALRSSLTYRGRPDSDIAFFYGLAGGLHRVLKDYPRYKRRAFYIDLGYWGRRKKSRYDGYHKIVLNSRHPTDYFQRTAHPSDRFDEFGVEIQPWRESGDAVMVIGMSDKAAYAEGLKSESWERDAVTKLKALTKRPIIYRPKPNWPGARPIPGTTMQRGVDLAEGLRGVHCVVARHSNVAVDSLLMGVPAICPHGVASAISSHDFTDIENPLRSDARAQFAADLAYTQFSIEEMASGLAWDVLRSEGLLG